MTRSPTSAADAATLQTRRVERRLLRHALGDRGLVATVVLVGLVGVGLIVAQAWLLSRIVDGVFLRGAGLVQLRGPLLWTIAVAAARSALQYLSEVVPQHSASALKRELRGRAWTRLLALGPARLGDERTGSLVATVVDGTDKLDVYFARFVPAMLNVAVVPAALALYVLSIDPLSGAILLITGPLIPLFMWLLGTLAAATSRRRWKTLGRLSTHFLEVIQGLPTLKLFGRARAQAATVARVSDHYRRATMEVLRVAFLSGFVLELAATLATALVAVGIGVRLVEGRLDFAPALLVLLLTPEFYLPFRRLGAEHHAGMEGVAAAEDLYRLLDRPAPEAGAQRLREPTDLHVQLERVSVRYPGASSSALDEVSLELRPGTVTALVGPSGAGKSTVAALLLGFVRAASGRVLVNDMPLAQLEPGHWRRQVAWVGQRPHLFAGTVLDNLRWARPDASDAEIVAAARAAAAHPFVMRLPDGYDTRLGEEGWTLSAGERQRLALARAFLKDARLLILDEASAQLDPDTEASVGTALARIAAGRTVLVVAHRLATVARADRIVVLEHGRVVEDGTHADLLARGGRYARMTQASS